MISATLNNFMFAVLSGSGTGSGSGGGGEKSGDLLTASGKLGDYIYKFAGILMMIVGIVALIIGVVQIVKGLAGGGKGQVNWVTSIATLLVGGMLLAGGLPLVKNFASLGTGTLENATGIDTGADAKTAKGGCNDMASWGDGSSK